METREELMSELAKVDKWEKERIFVVKCLQFTSSDIVGKRAILDDLSQAHQEGTDKNVISQIQGWREVIMTYGDNMGWKKLFQLIPHRRHDIWGVFEP